eukprot:COSAG01_NODE_37784_length_498_cov_262.586466_1_plen_30_part_10
MIEVVLARARARGLAGTGWRDRAATSATRR